MTEKGRESGSFWNRLGRGLRGGLEKGKQLGRLGLLKIDAQKARGERIAKYEEIGRLAVKRLRDADAKTLEASDPALVHLLEDLAEIEMRIADLGGQMDRARQSGETDAEGEA